MEELNVVTLGHRKESNVHLTSDISLLRGNDGESTQESHPSALILRLRVLQIVCGISALVMGSVAFIEERIESNLGLGIPAGGATVLAAAASIHQRGHKKGTGVPLALLWVASWCCHMALFVQSVRTLVVTRYQDSSDTSESDDEPGSSRDLVIIAGVQMVLTAATLGCSLVIARLQWGSGAPGGARPA